MSINPFCEIAVEEAVRLKEAGTLMKLLLSQWVHQLLKSNSELH